MLAMKTTASILDIADANEAMDIYASWSDARKADRADTREREQEAKERREELGFG